MMRQFT